MFLILSSLAYLLLRITEGIATLLVSLILVGVVGAIWLTAIGNLVAKLDVLGTL